MTALEDTAREHQRMNRILEALEGLDHQERLAVAFSLLVNVAAHGAITPASLAFRLANLAAISYPRAFEEYKTVREGGSRA